MSLADYDYQVWRKALHDQQVKLDNFDNDFLTHIFDNDIVSDEAYENEKAKFADARQKLVDELEALHRRHP